jgi:hypothetical protein
MTTVSDIKQLLTDLEDKVGAADADKALLAAFEKSLKDIAASLSDIVVCMEKPDGEKEPPPDFSVIVAAIDRIKASLDKPRPAPKPQDLLPLVQAIDRAATNRPAPATWQFEFDYALNGNVRSMRATPVPAV